jgi:hypothetical protein
VPRNWLAASALVATHPVLTDLHQRDTSDAHPGNGPAQKTTDVTHDDDPDRGR